MASSACTSRRRCAPRSPPRSTHRCRISSAGGSRQPHRMSCGAATSPTCPTGEGWLYVASVLDLGSRRLLGYSMAAHMRTELVADALKMAAAARGGQTAGIIFHGDRGSQYMSSDYRQLIADLDMVQSVGRTGVCWDNAVAESFWSSLKREVVHRYRFADSGRGTSCDLRVDQPIQPPAAALEPRLPATRRVGTAIPSTPRPTWPRNQRDRSTGGGPFRWDLGLLQGPRRTDRTSLCIASAHCAPLSSGTHASRISHAVKNAKPVTERTNPIASATTMDLPGRGLTGRSSSTRLAKASSRGFCCCAGVPGHS